MPTTIFSSMKNFASSKSKKSKKALTINVPTLSDFQANLPFVDSSTPTIPEKRVTKRRRSSTTASWAHRPPLADKVKVNDFEKSEDLEEEMPALAALRNRPAYYEDLHSLTAYGEIPLAVPSSDPKAACLQNSSVLTPASRLFEVAKPPAMAKRRRYTVATSRPSLGQKENGQSLSASTSDKGSDPGAANLSCPRRPIANNSFLFCESSPPPSDTSTASYSKSLSDNDSIECTARSSTLMGRSTPARNSTTSKPRAVVANVRYIPCYPYIVIESEDSPSDLRNQGVLSRVKYCIVD